MPNPRLYVGSLVAFAVCFQPFGAAVGETDTRNDQSQKQQEQEAENPPQRDDIAIQKFDSELRPLVKAISSGEHSKATDLVDAMRDEWEGKPQFDYLAGIVWAETGDYSEAVYAFERILILKPNHHRARLELARTHYMAENWASAQANFRKVLESGPPAAVADKVDAYLNAIEKERARQRGRFALSATAGIGYDSNVNSATDDATIDIGNLVFQLADSNRETSDLFLRWGIDGAYKQPISRTRRWSTTLAVEDKRFLDEDEYTLTDARAGANYTRESGKHSWQAGLQYSHYWQDSDQLVKLINAQGHWQYQSSERFSYNAFSTLGTLRYPGNRGRERDQVVLGGGGLWSHSSFKQRFTLYAALEPARSNAADHYGRNRLGLSGQSSWRLSDSQQLEGELSLLQSNFSDEHPVFNKEREDTLIRASVTWRYALTRKLVLNTQVSYRNNSSNIDLFSYDQAIAETGVRYRFF